MKNRIEVIREKRLNNIARILILKSTLICLLLNLFVSQANEINAQDLNIDSIKIELAKIENPQKKSSFLEGILRESPALDSISTFFLSESLYEIGIQHDSLAVSVVVANEMKASYFARQHSENESSKIRESSIQFMSKRLEKLDESHPKFRSWNKIIAGLNINLGLVYNKQLKFDKAIIKLEEALRYSKAVGLDDYVQKILTDMGNIYHSLGDYDTSTKYLLEAVHLPGKENSLYTIQTYKELGSLFLKERKDFDKAFGYYSKACSIADSLEHPRIDAYKNLAYAGLHGYYITTSNLLMADSVLQELEDIAVRIKSNYTLFFRYLAQAQSESEIKKQDYYLRKAEQIDYKKNKHMVSSMAFSKAEINLKRNNFTEARKFAEKSLKLHIANNNNRYIERDNKLLADICKKQKDYKSANKYLENYLIIKDSLMNEKIAKNQDVLNIKYETTKKQSEINELKNIELENQVQLTRQKNLLSGSIGGITLVGLLAGSLFQNYKKEKQTNLLLVDKNEIIKNKSDQNELLLKEIHHRVKNNLQTISSLLSLQSYSISDKHAKEAISVSKQRVESMALIHKSLYQRDNLAAIEMKSYIAKITKNLSDSYEGIDQSIVVNINMEELELDVDQAIPIGLILNELITNCYKYAFIGRQEGSINISIIKKDDDQYVLKVQDDGLGKKGDTSGFGSNLINLLTQQLNGKIMESNNNGYVFELEFHV